MCEMAEKQQSQVKRKKLADLFLILAIVAGMLLIFLEPPFVCPDENAHFINISRIAHGGLFADTADGKIGSYVSDEDVLFLQTYGGVYNGGEALTFDLKAMTQMATRPVSETPAFFETQHATLNPLPYILPALLIWVFKLLGFALNSYNSLLVAKMANLIFYALVIRWAILKTHALPKTMFMLGLMPMAIFQGASLSYDSPLIACSFLLIAYVTKLLCSDEQTVVTTEDIVAICLAAAFLIGCKIAYAPLLLLLLAIPIKKFGSVKRYVLCIGCVVATAVVVYVVPTLVNSIITAGCEIPLTDLQIQQQAYVKENPWILARVVTDTVKQCAVDWLRGFFGILGWLDTFFPNAFVWTFLLLMMGCAVVETSSVKGIRWNARVLALLGVGVFLVGTICTMYIQWNPVLVELVGGTLAHGGQGRYFIPVALFVVLACSSPVLLRFRVGEKLQRVTEQAVPIVSISYLCMTVLLILVRYWT